MKKKITCLILSVIMLFTCIPIVAFAGDLPDIKLEVPEFEVPDNMPDVFESLSDKYDLALKGLEEEGFGVNNFPDGLGELQPPAGFGSSFDKLPDAESIFTEKYGDMWNNKNLKTVSSSSLLDNKDEVTKEWKNSIPTTQKELTQKTLTLFEKMPQPDLNNYINNLENKYTNMFSKTLDGEIVYKNLQNVPVLEVKNKWADLMQLPSNLNDIKDEYAFKTDEQKKDMIDNRYLPEGYEDIKNTKLEESSKKDSGGFFNGIKNTLSNFFGKIFGKKDSVKDKAEQQKEKDSNKYKDIYKKYYYQGGQNTSKEQNEQRKQILDVFKEYGIYDRNNDGGAISRNEEKMGKLIEENMDLLEKEIPGFKSFK